MNEDPQALRQAITLRRDAMSADLERLGVALHVRYGLRRKLALHPVRTAAVVLAAGMLLAWAVRRGVRRARERRELAALAQVSQRSRLMLWLR